MELTMQSKPVTWLRCVLQEIRRQEETAEAIVPDREPDMETILDAYAVPMLRGKDVYNGGVTLTGELRGGILYLPAGDSYPRSLEYALPFSVKLDAPEMTEASKVICDLKVPSVDGKIINSRKAMLRAGLSCSVTAYEPDEQLLYSLTEHPEGLQVKQNVYDMQLPLATGEKSFQISDSVESQVGSLPALQIYRTFCRLELTDKKLVGTRAVFRGNAVCKLLYRAENQPMCVQELVLPFSQYCDLSEDYDGDENLGVTLALTGCEVEPENSSETGRFYVNLQVLAQCIVYGRRHLMVLEDAYSTIGVLEPTWNEFSASPLLDCPEQRQTVRQVVNTDIYQVLDTELYFDHPQHTRSDDEVVLTYPVNFHVLGYNREGIPCAAVGRGSGIWRLPLTEEAACTGWAEPVGLPYCVPSSEGLDLRTELCLHASCTGQQTVRTISGGTLEENGRRQQRPSVIIRRIKRGTPLWDIARDAGADQSALRQINDLEGELVPEDRVLLIPVG